MEAWRQARLFGGALRDHFTNSETPSTSHYVSEHEHPRDPTFTTPQSNSNNTSSIPTHASRSEPATRSSFAESYPRSAAPASMAQATSPSMSLPDGPANDHPHLSNHMKSNPEVPVDPNIAASSPTYPPYSPYAPQPHDMNHYQGHQPPGYPQHWPQQYGHHGMPGGPYSSPGSGAPGTPASAGPRPGQVYSFVPIPGAQQHKRPRRRYEEIERMYKCGWQGCEKAYGTLNHLNAHVTMQSHGTKRTPEEFKEIRKEWKQRKKDEENARKADEERARTANGGSEPQSASDPNQPPSSFPPNARPQLPPIGYAPAGNQVPQQYSGGVDQIYHSAQGNGQVYAQYPHSPYGQGQQM